jgi:hypothetical protein
MTEKSLGQIAEQVWIDLGEQGESDPDKLWQAAAEAVVVHAATNALHQSMRDVLLYGAIRPAERAVIKAARALINSKGLGFAVYEYATLKKAVEALEKVER